MKHQLYKNLSTFPKSCCGPIHPVLTVCDLKLCFGQDAARHRQSLADIVSRVCPLDRRDGQISTGRHRETTVGLLRLIWKQEVLHKQRKVNKQKCKEHFQGKCATWNPPFLEYKHTRNTFLH